MTSSMSMSSWILKVVICIITDKDFMILSMPLLDLGDEIIQKLHAWVRACFFLLFQDLTLLAAGCRWEQAALVRANMVSWDKDEFHAIASSKDLACPVPEASGISAGFHDSAWPSAEGTSSCAAWLVQCQWNISAGCTFEFCMTQQQLSEDCCALCSMCSVQVMFISWKQATLASRSLDASAAACHCLQSDLMLRPLMFFTSACSVWSSGLGGSGSPQWSLCLTILKSNWTCTLSCCCIVSLLLHLLSLFKLLLFPVSSHVTGLCMQQSIMCCLAFTWFVHGFIHWQGLLIGWAHSWCAVLFQVSHALACSSVDSSDVAKASLSCIVGGDLACGSLSLTSSWLQGEGTACSSLLLSSLSNKSQLK